MSKMRFKRNVFNIGGYHPTTFNMGELIPVQCRELIEGDTVQGDTSLLIRVSPTLAPVMHPVTVRVHHWFVPTRILWSNWEDFRTGGTDGNNTDTVPQTASITHAAGTLTNYMGVPTGSSAYTVNALPVRAYNMIYNKRYRDQDIITEVSEDSTSVQKIAWEKNQFTTARSSSQRGTEVSLPLGTTAPVEAKSGTPFTIIGDTSSVQSGVRFHSGTADRLYPGGAATMTSTETVSYSDGMQVDLSSATAATINDLRVAFATQNFMEIRQKYGANYVDYLAYLGITGQDSRLQEPEYLGGGKQTISFSEVIATAETGTSVDVGDLKGHGIAAVKSNRFRKFIPEHGYLLTLVSIRPKAIYANGLDKMWTRTDKEDFFTKELERIGQVEIENREIYINDTGPTDTFGWGARYHDYREGKSFVSGEFAPGQALDHFTQAISYSSDVALNQTFLECDPSTRIYASTATDNIWCFTNNNTKVRRIAARNPQPSIL
jgi:hypothetical protein